MSEVMNWLSMLTCNCLFESFRNCSQDNHTVKCGCISSRLVEAPQETKVIFGGQRAQITEDTHEGPSQWPPSGTRPSWAHRRGEQTQRSRPNCSLICTAWNDRPVCMNRSERPPIRRGPRREVQEGPRELREHSWSLRGGLLIACSTANWFSARSEREWQRVKGGISCFCIYNSVASCVCEGECVWKETCLI